MSKELKLMNDIKYRLRQLGYEEDVLKDCDLIITALTEYEVIQNAEPSEALKCLEEINFHRLDNPIKHTILISMFTSDYESLYNTIKQTLLQGQQSKHSLKWEDLEFEKEEQTMIVRLNGTEYDMKYFGKEESEFIMLQNDNNVVAFSDYCNKQFFNDLHLERVE